MQFRAVIFDMDGVLIDSEPYYLKIVTRELAKTYPWITEEDLYATVGMDSARSRRLLCAIAREPENSAVFDQEMERIHKITDQIRFPEVLYPEVPEVLERLSKQGFLLGLASSSSMRMIRKMLMQCGLESYFDVVISGEQFVESKPNPEIYISAIREMGCMPQECLVVEDSTYGVAAGVAAGACVAARRDSRFSFDHSKAKYHIETLRDLFMFL